jgi:SAM-dependent methyltransferase
VATLLRMPVLSRKLHLGAFDQVHDGWVNTDITPHLLVARVPGLPFLLHRAGVIEARRYNAYRDGTFRSLRYLDLSRRFRFPDACFECAFASHVLEHLHPDVAESCLREVHRVLVPGGLVRVSVPDLDLTVAEYDPADPDDFLWGIYQGRGRRAKRSARHWWHYNAKSLETLLRRVGFREVQRREYREGRCPDLERIDNRPGSLFMEAVK